ncbi:hypothetical protein ACFQ36_20590 [Arthrobacter sp. GCM10027362]|uniref:hypothetical protein n=1 Tax=Arthrobacter sp. GCM10027362 TaxID=3273379 RepID=UPI0036399D56
MRCFVPPGLQGIRIRVRTWWRSLSPIRATSCSRSRSRICTRLSWASCGCRSAAARASSCVRTSTAGSCRLVFLPRYRYTTPVLLRVEKELREAFNAESMDFEVRMSESALVRLFYRIRLPRGGGVPQVDRRELEERLMLVVRSWPEAISDALRQRLPGEQAAHDARRPPSSLKSSAR